MKHRLHDLHTHLVASPFEYKNLVIHSRVLKDNPLGDPCERHNYVLVPPSKKPLPMILHLSGYFGNGTQSFNQKSFEENLPELIVRATNEKIAPLAIHVFVDAFTALGGSQFIDSAGCGDYSSYILSELIPSVQKNFASSDKICAMGTSSGGYGALHLVSQARGSVTAAVAIAPDGHFESSLLPELYKAAPFLKNIGSFKKFKQNWSELKKKKNFFTIMNAFAMAMCYAGDEQGRVAFPIDLETGELDLKLWKQWQRHDPIHFLKERSSNLKGKLVYLEVGRFDEFCHYFGARQMRDVLQKTKCTLNYGEFDGGHFGLNERKVAALAWLKNNWF